MSAAPSPFDSAPSAAIDSLGAHEGPVFVDLDETLYLSNSTEDFINLARPGLVAAILLRLLDLLRPWRWSGGYPTRDVWRVRLVVAFFPWVRWRWARKVKAFAQRFGNTILLSAFERHSVQPIVLTAGFRPIVAPLVAALGLPEARIVAARLDTFDDRIHGKLQCAIDAVGEEAVRNGLLITDSEQDLEVLSACKRPFRTVWPGAAFRPALADIYLPGEYLTRVKRPGAHYIRRGILQEDFAFWLLSSLALAAHPFLLGLGLLLLLGSFWTVYEQGYLDNDRVADRYESDPKIESAYWDAHVATPRVQPWIWAAALGALGVGVIRWPNFAAPEYFLRWALVLTGTYGWFKLYNRVDKGTRVWMYAVLQLARVAAFTVLVPVLPIGAVALGANALARWALYHLYRAADKGWPKKDDSPLIRLTFFLVLAALLGVCAGPGSVFNWTGLALLGWNVFRARHSLATACRQASRLDRIGPAA